MATYDPSPFVCRAGSADPLVVAFKVYDMDRDGFISNGELYLVLKQMVGNNLKVSLAEACHVVPSGTSVAIAGAHSPARR